MNKAQKEGVQRLIEGYKRTIQMLENKEFMDGVYESLEAGKRGERGTRLSDIKPKRSRARRSSN
jgi:hypothetical protein